MTVARKIAENWVADIIEIRRANNGYIVTALVTSWSTDSPALQSFVARTPKELGEIIAKVTETTKLHEYAFVPFRAPISRV